MPPVKIVDPNLKPKKIVFGDDGEIVSVEKQKQKKNSESIAEDPEPSEDIKEDEDYFSKREKRRSRQNDKGDGEGQTKWFNVYPQKISSDEVVDMKDSEQIELHSLCKSAYEAELPAFKKKNSSDARWLQTALHRGTAKDRANAGTLLVTNNPLGNLEALTTLIGFSKISNKSSSDVVSLLIDLWKEVLLPPHRKLISLQMRAAEWKQLRKDITICKDKQKRIYAYWYFENELKDQYFEFLKNLQQGMQMGQENNKNSSIIAASHLLMFAPEKEQMLLTMLINKLGDPVAKVASKALHHLSDVAHKHPNMCGVIVAETEKLLFRNNISDRAQHFALCFLASIAPAGRAEVCTKLVHICFALFKVLVQKGAVNNRTMQAILRCLQKAILDAKPAAGSTEILNKEMQDTVYRLVHLADIRVSMQTLGLLLQLVMVKTEKSDRFYNALYKKLLDMDLTSVGTKTGAQLLHIVHRAIHIDANIQRAQAFIKRLLQISLYMPAHMAAGCLIVIHKLVRSRKELTTGVIPLSDSSINVAVETVLPKLMADDEELNRFDSDGEEKYEDIRDDTDVADKDDEELKTEVKLNAASWHHAKIEQSGEGKKVHEIATGKYDPYHRVPSFAGAEFSLRLELLRLREHFHPTVQVFADSILNEKRIDYYGDPLRDFALPHFLERFAFKNPKKVDNQKFDVPNLAHKRYMAFGARGKPVKSLTKNNCTEDEMFIFNFLEQKRQKAAQFAKITPQSDAQNEDDLELKEGEVNDDEFEDYLDGFFGKKAMAAAKEGASDDEEELDFLSELGGELKSDTKKKKKRTNVEEEDEDEIDSDWGDEDAVENKSEIDSDVSDDEIASVNNDDDDDAGSISLDENDGSDFGDKGMRDSSNESDTELSDNEYESDDEIMPPKAKKARKQTGTLDGRSFAKQLKHSDDMSSLFAAADDFAELLEETGKTKGQGTANAVFNKDKSSDKQIKWEEKRRSNTKTYTKKHKTGKLKGAAAAKKRKN